jgi:broad specificity phosphatase PhoE
VPRLYLVRHGRPAGTFADASDAGLDPIGVAQAEAMAGRLGPLGPLPIVVSPLRRTRETAAPLERRWSAARVEPAVGEIPTPAHVPFTARGDWLRSVMAGAWRDVDPALRLWRDRVLAALAALPESAVVVSHFVAINVAVGAATGDDRVASFSPDHCSVTVLDVGAGRLRLVQRGADGVAARPM